MEVVATRAGISRTTLYKVERGDPAGLENDLQQLFRRVAFNVAVGNRDDHLRNHGFILGEGGWHLAPAFDVNPDPEKATHVLAIDDADTRPDVATVLANPVPVVVPYLP